MMPTITDRAPLEHSQAPAAPFESPNHDENHNDDSKSFVLDSNQTIWRTGLSESRNAGNISRQPPQALAKGRET